MLICSMLRQSPRPHAGTFSLFSKALGMGHPPNDGKPVLYVLHFQDVHSNDPLPRPQQKIAFTDLDAEDGNFFLTFQFSNGSAWTVSFRNFDYYAHDYDI